MKTRFFLFLGFFSFCLCHPLTLPVYAITDSQKDQAAAEVQKGFNSMDTLKTRSKKRKKTAPVIIHEERDIFAGSWNGAAKEPEKKEKDLQKKPI